jgi:hypothetical protein
MLAQCSKCGMVCPDRCPKCVDWKAVDGKWVCDICYALENSKEG